MQTPAVVFKRTWSFEWLILFFEYSIWCIRCNNMKTTMCSAPANTNGHSPFLTGHYRTKQMDEFKDQMLLKNALPHRPLILNLGPGGVLWGRWGCPRTDFKVRSNYSLKWFVRLNKTKKWNISYHDNIMSFFTYLTITHCNGEFSKFVKLWKGNDRRRLKKHIEYHDNSMSSFMYFRTTYCKRGFPNLWSSGEEMLENHWRQFCHSHKYIHNRFMDSHIIPNTNWHNIVYTILITMIWMAIWYKCQGRMKLILIEGRRREKGRTSVHKKYFFLTYWKILDNFGYYIQVWVLHTTLKCEGCRTWSPIFARILSFCSEEFPTKGIPQNIRRGRYSTPSAPVTPRNR